MAKFTSNSQTATTITAHAMSAFNIDNPEHVNVTSKPWGVMVEVLFGENKGVYDYFADENSFITA